MIIINTSSFIKALINEINKSKEFKALKYTKSKINNDKFLSKQSNNYETKQFKILSQNIPQVQKEKKLHALENQYKDFLSNKTVKEYIKAVNNFQQLVLSVYENINKEINNLIK